MTDKPTQVARPQDPASRYRLYIDESGDHVFREPTHESHRFLCLLGCWFRGADYLPFHEALTAFKQAHIPHSPDEPLILHREDMVNARGAFWRLRDPSTRAAFDNDLLALIQRTEFRVVGVVIDKLRLREGYRVPGHPYHLALGFLLQRYCGYLNHVNRVGDVMAESRGGAEDRLLKDSYSRVFERGVWMTGAGTLRQALTSKELKLRPKSADISGLQLADLLCHPVRQAIAREAGLLATPPPPFAARLLGILEPKFNRHLYDGRVDGYGKVLFPK